MPVLLYSRNAIKGLGEAFASPCVSLCLCVFVSLCLCAASPVAVAAAPTVTISTTKSAQSTGVFTATFTFSEAVTGFVATDLTVTNGTASGFSGTGTTYTATITPDNDDVVVTLTVPTGAATDAAGNPNTPATTRPYPPARLQQAYVDQSQGMFIHFSLESFLSVQWAPNNTDINTFNPSDLDTDQWADAAVEAGLRFGVLTAKHHNGFTLWDTSTAETGPSAHDVFETSWCTAEKSAGRSCDVMKRYADSFRSRGLGVGVYFSIWDHKAGLTKAGTENNQTLTNGTNPTEYIKQQLLELLGDSTNRPYGEIEVVWFDGWDLRENAIGNLGVPEYRDIPYAPIRDYVRSISPNTLIVNNDKKDGPASQPYGSLTTSDIATVEQYINLNNPLPAKYVERSWTIASDNTWFWNPGNPRSEAPRQLADAADGIIAMRNKGGLTLFNFGPDARGQISTPYRNYGKLLGYAIRQDSLAQGKTATQSSTYTVTTNTGAGEALDGFFNESAGMAHTNTGASNANPWWQVDLGQEQRVDTVVLFNRTNAATRQRLSNLTVEVRDADNTVVHTSATINANNALNGPQGLIVHLGDSGAGVSGRYVRVNKRTANSSNVNDVVLALAEVMVFAPPSVTITPSSNAHGGTPFTATLTFSEPVTGFTLNDLTVTDGTASGFSGAGTTYTVTITPRNNSTDVVLNVAANVATNAASRGNTAATAVTVPASDTIAPTVTIDAPSAHNGRAFAATFTFSEAVSGFDAVADITVTGATAAAPTPVSGAGITAGTTYRAIITPATPARGEALANITLAVPAAAATDAAGNNSVEASAVTVPANSALPSVNIRTSRTTHNGAGTFTATLSFNKDVTGFVAADLTVSGGSVRSFSGSGRSYTATIAPNSGRSNVVLSVAANVATDTDNNGNLAAIPVTVIADTTAPTVTISAPSAHNGAAFTATFTFSEAVSGFDAATDITVGGGTAGTPTAVTGGNITAGTTYQATITPTDDRTDVALSVAANVASDAAGNANTAAAAVNVTTTPTVIDTTAPTVTISAPSAHNGRPFAATFTFDEAVSGFDAVADITVTGGTADAPTPVGGAAGSTYRAIITPASGAALADITLAVPAAAATDAAGNTSEAASAVTVPASSNPPSVSIRTGKPGVAANDRGDLALVPYYTVMADWVTGLHIVNTSERTQVVKMRFRRATDGLGALDFNVVLSPRDVYAGFLSDTASGDVLWSSPDTSCTVPASSGNRLVMPAIYRAGADSGYVEVIAMGSPSSEQQPIAVAAASASTSSATGGAAVSTTGTSTAGLPRDCAALRSNFYADGAGTVTSGTTKPGVEDHATTWQRGSAAAANAVIQAGGRNTYEKSGNVLKVSYFIRNNATGIEFGDNAVHIRNFLDTPSITNQEYGLLSGDLNGFEFPDLNGGVPLEKVGADATSVQRGRFDALRASAVLGADRLLNEWSANPANGVEMNWVVTLPGQYTMLRLPQYAAALASTASASSAAGGMGHPAPRVDSAGNLTPATVCPRQAIPANGTGTVIAECDYRDLPVELEFTAYNREQRADTVTATVTATGELVVAPTVPTAPSTRLKTYLPQVANVITFGGKRVFGPMAHNIDVDLGQPYGWVSARVRSRDADVRVCDWDRRQDNGSGFPGASAGQALTLECSAVTNKNVPVIGFAAWSRKMAVNPDASYGRIVQHSYRAEAATPSTTPSP